MNNPKRIDFTPEQIEELVERIEKQQLEPNDFSLLLDVLRAMIWLEASLSEKELSIHRLRKIFGIKTESAKKLYNMAKKKAKAKDDSDSAAVIGDAGKAPESENTPPANSTENAKDEEREGAHGHRPASDYQEAEIVSIAHEALRKGSLCPACLRGKLFNLVPGTVLRIVGQPWLKVQIYKPERLRCSACGKTFVARLPLEVATQSRSDPTANAIVSLLKYHGGLPFYRQETLQDGLGTPISASEIWEMTEKVANDVQPVHVALCEMAAQAELIHNDDTSAKVLSLLKENREKALERKGIFTTALLAICGDLRVALYFTGRQHAGENLESLLQERTCPDVPIQMCDGSSRNIPKESPTKVGKCNAHSRRKFYELAEKWPREAVRFVSLFDKVFENDRMTIDMNPLERLSWHKENSAPLMNEIKQYGKFLIESKQAEPNSSLGKAISYFENHWEGLTLFLQIPGVPISNNANERLIKRVALNRKNSYFFKTENGSRIADVLLSTIETCNLNNINPYSYLVAVQKHRDKVLKNPKSWFPWNYPRQDSP